MLASTSTARRPGGFSKLKGVPALEEGSTPRARGVVIPLTMKGPPLRTSPMGSRYESKAAARRLRSAYAGVIRLGWEMTWLNAWFAGGHEAEYIKAFRRVVEIFRRHSTGFKFDWCPGWGPQEMPADTSYPGDDVVDYIGLDVYDFKHEGTPEERWNNFYVKAPFGLEWHREFARLHGKRMSYPEWGVGNFGDNRFLSRCTLVPTKDGSASPLFLREWRLAHQIARPFRIAASVPKRSPLIAITLVLADNPVH